MIKYPVINVFNNLGRNEYYWYGVLWADGCIEYTDKAHRVRLESIDKDLVEKFKNFISPSRPMYFREEKGSWRVEIHSTELSKNLFDLKVITGRSRTAKNFIYIPDEYIPDFLRGFLDGDGTVGIYNTLDKRVGITYIKAQIRLTTINKNIAKKLVLLFNKIGINCLLVHGKNKTRPDCFYVVVSRKQDQLNFLKKIYEHSNETNRMDRKYQISCQIMELLRDPARVNRKY